MFWQKKLFRAIYRSTAHKINTLPLLALAQLIDSAFSTNSAIKWYGQYVPGGTWD